MKKRTKNIIVLGIIVALAGLILAVINSEDTYKEELITLKDFENKLEKENFIIDLAGEVDHNFFSANGRILNINGERIQVFEYSSVDVAKSESSLVHPDGLTIGTEIISWTDTPHFFRKGNLIALYTGNNLITLEVLEKILGEQFAGGPTGYTREVIEFIDVAKGSPGIGIKDNKNFVTANEESWEALWNELNLEVSPKPSLPKIDFANSMTIGVFYGEKSSEGHSIRIVEVVEENNQIKVLVEKEIPGEGCIVAQSLTYPYHIVQILKNEKPVEFVSVENMVDC